MQVSRLQFRKISMEKTAFNAAVITVSDSGAAGKRTDESGPALRSLLEKNGYTVVYAGIIPDERTQIAALLQKLADSGTPDGKPVHLILTTGGTGFSPRDVTPEATLDITERAVPGIPEAMRAASLRITPRAMLSRAAAGIRKQTLIINFPGSPKACEECLGCVLPALEHGLAVLTGQAHNCAR